ncbi:capsule assembly Wzi family protein [Aquirufa nivalisilvae]|uniref:capsule assembly Wzi family protein n=1 Tax=Aquirufa nivalisilvae TaxID=2516557 RepID=UPI0022A990AD|nr:capsule assembly Wzi family protein [Aquirufa nivalisilvae]
MSQMSHMNQLKQMIVRKVLVVICLFLCSNALWAQREINSDFSLGMGGTIGGVYNPLWLRANQYGLVPASGSYGFSAFSHRMGYRPKKQVDWAYGFSTQVNLGENKADVFFPELYVKSKVGIFELVVGRQKQIFGLVDSTLSSGSYIWSGNALPIPKVELQVKEYWSPGFLKGVLAFKGNYSHGWFENSREDVKDFYLHQKSFYGRFGKPNWKVKFYAGFNHQVQWGGKLKYADPYNVNSHNGIIPSDFNTYVSVVTGRSNAIKGDTATYGYNDGFNRSGNHLGTVDIGLEVELNQAKIFFYRQSIYEDGSLYYGNNITDGLHGLSITRKADQGLIKVVLEYLNTTSQGGNTFNDQSKIRGFDDYLNNGVYQNGWTYFGKGIGTPLLTLDSESDLNPTNSIYYDNNRVEAFYAAGEFAFGDNKIQLRASLSNAIGWFGKEYSPVKKQYSGGILWHRRISITGFPEALLKANLGIEKGNLTQPTLGGNIAISIPLN